MATPRFHCNLPLAPDSTIALPAAAAQHAVKALRLHAGDAVTLFNGDGYDYHGVMRDIDRRGASVVITARTDNAAESALDITLLQCISSGERMDFTIQKAVELGVNAIQPISSQRSTVRLIGERAEKRREHWQNVVISASEQCGRARVPPVAPAMSLQQWAQQTRDKTDPTLRIALEPGATRPLAQIARPESGIALLVGAEGGLSPDEIALAAAAGFTLASLGPRVLRTETAALAAVAAMQALWGDFRTE